MIGFEAGDATMIRDLLDRTQDTTFEVLRVAHVADAPTVIEGGGIDVGLLDLTHEAGSGVITLARAEIVASNVPIVSVIEDSDEPQLLHLGSRDHLVRSQMNARLLTRTLRTAVEHQRLVEELRIAKQREHFLATRDSMTGLPNRFYFSEQLDRSLAWAQRNNAQVAVYFLDLDRFKQINETLGHDVGDSLIITMADRLSRISRTSDMVARAGGDEFLMMVQGKNLDYGAPLVAENIRESLARPFRVDGHEYSFTGSVGVAVSPRDGHGAVELIHKADAAMHQAKGNGRSTYQLYDRSVSADTARKLALEGRLRGAIERGQLSICYQPRVDATTRRTIGCEALARWCDPKMGDVSPVEFVPIAEENGSIVAIGEWVIDAACHQQQKWIEMGYRDLVLSVNLSARQLHDESVRDVILGSLMRSGLDPHRLEVEITESALISKQDVAARILGELSEHGVGISLDDFGTGFSSLSYLKRFPVDRIKIDRSFVRDLDSDPDDAAITEAIISIAEKLRLGLVAEGVETDGQREFLRSRGCVEMQGFLFSPPVSADDFEALLRDGLPRP
jgi:diguanylate cyclase (GGDEF)-like protein